jgi:UDP-N-acetylglucosamine 1-carboxyvinyltransferase
MEEKISTEEKLKIFGGTKLCGSVTVDGSKNGLLPVLAATILCDGEIKLNNCVDILDCQCMIEILKTLNISTIRDGKTLHINTFSAENQKITHELTQKVRASIFVLGALLGRFRKATIAFPGGCQIGSRPIDIHLEGFRTLGAKVIERHGYIYCNGENLKAGDVVLNFPSVGATESLMMCACLLKGKTRLFNVAKEPEVVCLQDFLNKMGAHVGGAGTDTIEIDGVEKLHGGAFRIIPDRIVAGTYMLAVATCGGDVTIYDALASQNCALIAFLKQTACQIDVFYDRIRLKVDKRLSSIDKIQTLPYPFFPTDLQPQMMVLQSVSQGTSTITENIFESRFALAGELEKMGAKIVTSGRTAVVSGVEKLYGADVFASDLRAGASLVIAGMKAEGYTTISNIHLIDRGYEKIEEKFSSLGALVKRVKD